MQWLGRRTKETGGQLRQWMGGLGVAARASTVAAQSRIWRARALLRMDACMHDGRSWAEASLGGKMGETPDALRPDCVTVRPLLHSHGRGRSQCEGRRVAAAEEWLEVKPVAGCNVGAGLSRR